MSRLRMSVLGAGREGRGAGTLSLVGAFPVTASFSRDTVLDERGLAAMQQTVVG